MEINLEQAKTLVDCFGGDEEIILTIVNGDENFHSGPGLYVRDEYPEHGYIFLDEGGD